MADSQVQEVKEKVDILQVVSERIQLTRSGRNFKACCPFHAEKTPSFSVREEEGSYHCFGCGKHGSVYDYDTWVPVVFAGPGVIRGRFDHRVGAADVAPTLAALLGIETPADLDGADLGAGFRGE